MPRGSGRGRKPGGGAGDGRGRKRVPAEQAAAIQSRLRDFLTKGGQSTVSEFKKEPFFEAATVDGWFRAGRVPDVSTVLRLAQEYDLDPSYLLLGKADPAMGQPAEVPRSSGLESALRRAVIAGLLEKFPDHSDVVRAAVPWGTEILEEIVSLYEEEVRKRLAKYPGQVRLRWFKNLVEEPDLRKRRKMADQVGPMLNLTGPILPAMPPQDGTLQPGSPHEDGSNVSAPGGTQASSSDHT